MEHYAQYRGSIKMRVLLVAEFGQRLLESVQLSMVEPT